MKKLIFFMWVPVLLLIPASPACANSENGLLLDRTSVDPQIMSSLETGIAEARLESPWAFENLAAVVAGLPDRPPTISRSGRDPIVPVLTRIGPDGLFPMLEMLVIRAPSASGLDLSLTNKLKLALIRAVGLIRDPRAVPIMKTILLADEMDIWARKEAAFSFTHLPTDNATALLFSILDNGDSPLDARRAVYSVIGRCHELDVAKRLAEDLYAKPDQETATSIVTALAELGNRGVWEAFSYSGDERIEEKEETTQVVTEAIIWAFVNYENPDLREAAGRGLRLTQHTSTNALIQEERAKAVEDTKSALDLLEEEYVRSVERSKRNTRGYRTE